MDCNQCRSPDCPARQTEGSESSSRNRTQVGGTVGVGPKLKEVRSLRPLLTVIVLTILAAGCLCCG